MSKKTQTDLLQEIVDLLTPINNLAIYEIGKINKKLNAKAAVAHLKKTKTAEDEMKKEAERLAMNGENEKM